ncbi:MAG: heavy metal sensor histidine kinase [Nitrospiraceae bacterium]
MSLRVRLTLWYGTALAVILLLFAGALYGVMAGALKDQVDRSLEEAASVAIRSLEERRFGPFLMFEDLSVDFPELAVLDKFFQIFGPSGKITIQSPNIRSRDIPLSHTALDAAFAGNTTFESARFQGEPPLRLISVPIRHGGALVNIVRVGTSLQSVQETLHRLLVILLVTGPVALLAALAGGWLLAGRALRPVAEITRAAQRIADGDLTQRLTVPPSQDEIGRLGETFNDMIARLETSFRQVRQFSTDASHELRTPLTVLKGETELALRRPRSVEDYRLVLESGLEEIDRMTRIVDELMFLSRADLGEIKMEFKPVRLDALVEDVRHQAAVLGHEPEVQVVTGTVTPAAVSGDELRLRELLLNLVDNAVKYSFKGGTVELNLATEDRTARLSVTDSGIGIAPQAQAHIFQRFYRTDEARAHAKKGTGLGLSISKWIVDAHGGTIDVKSEPGKGTTFTIALPLTEP